MTTTPEAYGGGNLATESADGAGLSFREALGLAISGDTITFDLSLSGLSIVGSRIENNPAVGTTINTSGGTVTIMNSSMTANFATNTIWISSPTSATISGSTIAHNNYNGVIVSGPLDMTVDYLHAG